MAKKTKQPNIKLAERSVLADDEFEPKNVRVAISIKVPLDVLNAYRARAERENRPYQTIMNEVLREGADKPSIEERLARLEQKIGA